MIEKIVSNLDDVDGDDENEISLRTTVFTKVSNLDKFRRGAENVLRLEVAVEETVPLIKIHIYIYILYCKETVPLIKIHIYLHRDKSGKETCAYRQEPGGSGRQLFAPARLKGN